MSRSDASFLPRGSAGDSVGQPTTAMAETPGAEMPPGVAKHWEQALDPAWRSGGIAPAEGSWEPASSVAVYGADAELRRNHEQLRYERRIAALMRARRLQARLLEAEAWEDELEDLAVVGSRARIQESTARQSIEEPIGFLEGLLHPHGRGLLAAGVAGAAAVKGLLLLLPAKPLEDGDAARAAAARRWTGAALVAGVLGLVGVAQGVGADGVRADRRTALKEAEAARTGVAREQREAQRKYAAWVDR